MKPHKQTSEEESIVDIDQLQDKREGKIDGRESYLRKRTDQMTSEFIQSACHNRIFHSIAIFLMKWITDEGIGLSLGFFAWFIDYRDGIAILLGMALQEIINGCLKWIIQRPRPHWKHLEINNAATKFEKDFSFPSSHSQTALHLSTMIYFLFLQGKNEWYFIITSCIVFTVPLLTGISRIYLGVHFVSDVFVGWLLGFLTGYAMYKVFDDAFEGFLELNQFKQWLCCFSILGAYLLLHIIRTIVPPPNDELKAEWIENVTLNFSNVKKYDIGNLLGKRNLDKYNFHILSMFGGFISFTITSQIEDLQIYLIESCGFKHELDVKLLRLFVGYIGLIFILPTALVLPSCLKPYINKYRFIFQWVGFMGFGVWIYMVPYITDQMFDKQCPVDLTMI